MNAIRVIKPYQYEGLWVFDDPAQGLDKEALIGGTDVILEKATAHIPNAKDGFLALFSDQPFPGAQLQLDWTREHMSGNMYRLLGTELEGWLCPALLKYFAAPPKQIFVEVRALTK